MSKKPVPKKKQAVSSTRARHATWVRKSRTKLENQCVTDECKNCGQTKRRHFVCEACGFYKDKQVVTPKTSGSSAVQEIEA